MLAFAQAEEKAGVRCAQLMLRRRVGAACKLLLLVHLKQRMEFFCSSSAEVQHGVGGAPLAYPSKRRARQRACLGACHLSWKQGKDARAVPRPPTAAAPAPGPRGAPAPPRPAASPRGRALATARTRRQREAPARQRRADPERCPWAPPPGATMSDPRPG